MTASPLTVARSPSPERDSDESIRHLESLTGVRSLAAVWVVGLHLAQLAPLSGLAPFLAGGYLGVDLFFTLSGFVISHRYLERFGTVRPATYAHYLWLRLARIYPVHLAVLLCLAVIVVVGTLMGLQLRQSEAFTVSSFVRHLVLLQVPLGPTEQGMLYTWNVPAWSISAEFMAYLTFPLFVVALRRRRPALAVLLGMLLCYLAFWLLRPAVPAAAELIRVVAEFASGCCAYRLFLDRRLAHAPWPIVGTLSLVIAVIAGTLLPFHGGAGYLVTPLFAVLVLALAHGDISGRRGPLWWIASPPAVMWGRWSYSLYMTHYPVIFVLQVLATRVGPIGGPVWPLLLAALNVSAIALAARVSYGVVEEPGRAIMRRLIVR